MANEVNSYTIDLNALTKKVEELRNEEKKLKQQQDQLTKSFKAGKIGEDAYAKSTKALTQREQELKTQQEALAKTIKTQTNEAIRQQMEKADGLGKSFNGFASILQGNVAGAIGGLKEAFNTLGGVGGLAVGALIAGVSALVSHFQEAKQKLKDMRDAFNELKDYKLPEFDDWEVSSEDNVEKLEKAFNDATDRMAEKRKGIEDAEKNMSKDLTKMNDALLAKKSKEAERLKAIIENEQKSIDLWKSEYDKLKGKADKYENRMNSIADTELNNAVEIAKAKGESETKIYQQALETEKAQEASYEKQLETIKASYKYQVADERNQKAMVGDLEKKKTASAKRVKTLQEKYDKQLHNDRVDQISKEKTEKEKAIEDAKQKQKEADEERKRRAEEQAQADKEALKTLEDLQVQMIEDDTERQKSELELNKKRTIQALTELSSKASELGKKNIKEAINALQKINMQKIDVIDANAIAQSFSNVGANITQVLKEFMEKPLVDAIKSTTKMTDDQFKQLWEIENANVVKTLNEFDKFNDDRLAQLDTYKQYIEQLYADISRYTVEPPIDTQAIIDVKTYNGELSKTEAIEAQMAHEKVIVKNEEDALVEKENQRYQNSLKNIAVLTGAESKRMQTFKNAKIAEIKATRDAEYKKKEIEVFEGKATEEELAEINAKYAKQMADVAMDVAEKREELDKKTNIDIEKAREAHEKSLETIQINSKNKQLLIEQEASEKRKELLLQEYQQTVTFIDGMSSAFNALAEVQQASADDETKSDAEREKARRKALNLQIAGIFLSMASALAQGIANATDVGFPALLASVPATIAVLIADFAQIKSVMAQRNSGGYAEGGYVSGAGSSTSDSISTRLSNGEYVVRANGVNSATIPLLDSINYGGANSLANQFALALQAQPAPIVDVQTIERVNTEYNQMKVYSHL